MLLGELVAVSREVARTSARRAKVAALADVLRRLAPEETAIAIPFLAGSLRQRTIGVGWAAVREAADTPAATAGTLSLSDVDACFQQIAVLKGVGSTAARVQRLRELFASATADEQDFLKRLIFGELRQGAVEGVLLEAVASATAIPADRLRRAAMISGSLAAAGVAALSGGEAALRDMDVTLFAPVQPMLAASAEDVEAALDETGAAAVEFKLDGARIQVHKDGDDVRVYSRSLRDVSGAVADVVAAVRQLPVPRVILDGEAIALRPDGTPHPFQTTMRRFGRKQDADVVRETLPLSPFFFDLLWVDGHSALDDPFARRVTLLDAAVPQALQVPRVDVHGAADAAVFAARAAAAGHEGVMVKALDAPYAAGRRGSAWVKVKRAQTLDLVVLAAEWGSGRRTGTLSNLHLGARDEERGGFVMLGKTFKGLTDEMLAWQTREFLAREIGRDGHIVFVKPEMVVEIAFNDLQDSPIYPGRLALRFARVKRYRSDKTAAAADTYETVRRLYSQATGLEAPERR